MRTSIFPRVEKQAEINNKLTHLEVCCLPVTTFLSATVQSKQVSEGHRSRHTVFVV